MKENLFFFLILAPDISELNKNLTNQRTPYVFANNIELSLEFLIVFDSQSCTNKNMSNESYIISSFFLNFMNYLKFQGKHFDLEKANFYHYLIVRQPFRNFLD